jgi:diguanylate cyclase (GGDEF)-like protein/PAS domain S-box-containing protein
MGRWRSVGYGPRLAQLVSVPHGELARSRWTLLIANLCLAVVSVVGIVLTSQVDAWLRAAGLCSLAWIALRRMREYRGLRGYVLEEAFEGVAIVLIGLAAGEPTEVLGIVYASLLFRSMFGSRIQVAAAAAILLGGYLTSLFLTQGEVAPSTIANHVVGFTLFTTVTHLMATAQLSHERSLERTREIMRAGSALVSAADRDTVYEVAVQAAYRLSRRQADARVSLALGDAHTKVVKLAIGHEADAVKGREVDVEQMPAAVRDALRGTETVEIADSDPRAIRRAGGFLPKVRSIIVAPFLIEGEPHGALIVASNSVLPPGLKEGLSSLASQVSLALEGAAIIERRSEQRFRSLVQNASDVISIVEDDGTIRYLSPSVERVFGYLPDELIARNVADLAHPEDLPRIRPQLGEASTTIEGRSTEMRARRRDGSWLSCEVVVTNLRHDPNIRGWVLTCRDITERKSLEEQLAHQAFHDSLTGLANRALFGDRVEHALMRARRSTAPLAVLFIDLDKFKNVNDTLGHRAGDELLESVAVRLRSALRVQDTAARLGGDEFAVLLEDVDESTACDIAERLLRVIGEPFTVQQVEVLVGASIGISMGDSSDVVGDVLRKADTAMYAAKERGRGRYELFRAKMEMGQLHRLELHARLKRAIDQDELTVHYQPVVSLDPLAVVGVEALVRWQHPTRGLLYPGDFISVAEETGLIEPLGNAVLEQSCAQAAAWSRTMARAHPLRIGVNFSARQLQQRGCVDSVASALRRHDVDPELIVLEITESVLMEDPEEVAVQLELLRGLGVNIAIDDFGTGYSSLSYLRRFPVRICKIDRFFVGGMDGGPEESAYARAIIKLGHSLGLDIVAEGVETRGELEELTRAGCDFAQGYLFARPAAAADIEPMLTSNLSEPAPA